MKEILNYESTNPIEILWDLLKIPEEDRIKTAHLWDYLNEEVKPKKEE